MAVSPRVQVLVKPEIFDIVNEMAEDQNIPLSRVCGLLIEQALVNRGLWDSKLRKRLTPELLTRTPDSASLHRTDLLDLPGVTVEKMSENKKASDEPQTDKPESIESLDLDPELLVLAKKLKALKSLDLI